MRSFGASRRRRRRFWLGSSRGLWRERRRLMPSLLATMRGPWRAVWVLGLTQIIAWGAIFYSPVLLVPLIAAERGWSLSFSMGGFSLALLVAGMVAPMVGRSIDRYGGHVVMTIGALVSAVGLVGLAV